MSSPLVSVVVITYNQEQSLPVALDSILTQRRSFDLEIIVGEDCSKDNTREVLKGYESRYPGIVKALYNAENKGILQNFKRCVEQVQGEYVAFCDGDDYWCDPEKLSKQVSILTAHPDVGLVYTDVKMDSRITGEQYYRAMASPRKDLFTQLLEGNIIVSSTVCLRRCLLEKVDFEEFVREHFSMEDYPMWLSLSLETVFQYLPEATACYVIERGVVNSNDVGHHAVRFDEETTRIRIYFKNKYPDRTSLTIDQIEDAHFMLGVRSGLNMNDRKFVLHYVDKLHRQTPYSRRLKGLCKSRIGFHIYQLYRSITHKNKSQLQQYFGM